MKSTNELMQLHLALIRLKYLAVSRADHDLLADADSLSQRVRELIGAGLGEKSSSNVCPGGCPKLKRRQDSATGGTPHCGTTSKEKRDEQEDSIKQKTIFDGGLAGAV